MEKYEDLLKQAEYARFINRTRARVCQKVKGKSVSAVYVGGTKMIKLSPDEIVEYRDWKKEQEFKKVLAN